MKYEDIINLPHHVSDKRQRMSNYERAAQFSPFAALTGYDEEIDETARLTGSVHELTEDEMSRLDAAIQRISELYRPTIRVTYFVPDERKSGGAYVQYKGQLRFLETGSGRLKFMDSTEIAINAIVNIEFE